MPKRKFKKCWDQERVEREKRWRKEKMSRRQDADRQIRKGLDQWQNDEAGH